MLKIILDAVLAIGVILYLTELPPRSFLDLVMASTNINRRGHFYVVPTKGRFS